MSKKKKTRKEKYATEYPIVSQWSQSMRWFLAIASIGLIVIGCLFYTHNPQHRYWQIADMMMWLILASFLIFSLLALFGIKKYIITENTLTVRNYWHRAIRVLNRNELLGYFENTNKDKNENTTGKTLVITTAGRPIKISSYYYNNYGHLKNELIKGLKRDKEAENKSIKGWGLRACIFIIIVAGGLLTFQVKDYDAPPINKNDFTILDGNVEHIEFMTRGSRPTSYSIELKLEKNPEFTFKMSDKVWNKESLKKTTKLFTQGDPISIAIRKEHHNKKITKTDSLDFWDKHNRFHIIRIASISKGDNIILPLNSYIEEENAPFGFGDYFVVAFALVMLSIGLYLMYIVLTHKSNSS